MPVALLQSEPDFLTPLLLATTAFFAVLSAYLLIVLRNRELQKRKDREYATLLEQATDAIFLFSHEGRILVANHQACQLLARPSHELVGHDLCEFLAPEAEGVLREALEEARVQAGGRFELSRPLAKRDGTTFWIEARGRLLDPKRVLAVVRDQTQSKELEQANAELATRLVERQRMESLGKLAGGVAHDFNNLMTVVLANADEASSRVDPHSPARTNLAKIVTAAQRAGELTQQLLAYSGQSSFHKARVDVNELVAELGSLLRSAIPIGVDLSWELAGRLPFVEGDAARLRQVVMNLVLNAADAIPDAGSIVIRTHRVPEDWLGTELDDEIVEGDGVLIEVIDDGTGMTSEIRDQIFDPFFTTKATGRGLGLAACQGIVRGHDGALSVESTWGEGSTFRVLLPGRAGDDAAPSESAPEAHDERSGRILVVDDNPDVRDSTAAMLRRFGYEAVVASGGREGLAEFERDPGAIDCALVDLSMPGMDGHATAAALRGVRDDLPIVLMSGFAAEHEGARFDGATFTLQKPFAPSALREKIRRALEARVL